MFVEPRPKRDAHLEQLRHDGQHLWVADVNGIVPVGLLLVADVSQVEDGRQQREDPDGKQGGGAVINGPAGIWRNKLVH